METASMGGSLLSHPSQCAKAVIFLVLILLCRCEDRAAELSPNSALVRGAADAGDPDASAEGPSLPGLEPAGVPAGLRGTVFPFQYNNFRLRTAFVTF